jgi:DNA-binding transcriptional ArsR family regulator
MADEVLWARSHQASKVSDVSMRIESTRKQTPFGSPQSGQDHSQDTEQRRFVWETLAPRLLHPSKLAFIQVLLEHEQPLTLGELAEAAEITKDHAGYHCKSMRKAGVLEVVNPVVRPDGEREEPTYFFPKSLGSKMPCSFRS